ncbi:MAG: hypothetical protein AAFZ63_02035 [Bacteroidota bacterium]
MSEESRSPLHRHLLLLSLICLSVALKAQSNLVLNPSLEVWENGMPINWEIIANTVDIFQSNYRVIPTGVSPTDTSFRARFPIAGSEGDTYFGLHYDEIIKVQLRQPLEANSYYKLSFSIGKPPIYNTEKVTNIFTCQFATPGKQTIIIPITADSVINASRDQWTSVETTFSGFQSKDELSFGFFGDYWEEMEFGPISLYYLFDNIQLHKGEILTETITLRFAPNSFQLNEQQKRKILAAIHEREIHSIELSGYASVIGDEADNFVLAGERVHAVTDILAPYDFPITSTNQGESQSTAGNESTDRRVVIEIKYYQFGS